MHDLSVSADELGPVLVVRVRGQLFLPDASPLMAQLAASMSTPPHRSVVCDLSELSGIASDWALTVFPAALRRVGGWPCCSLRLAQPSPSVGGQLERMRMRRYLPVHATVDDAVRHAQLDADLRPHDVPMDPDPAGLRALRGRLRELWPYSTRHGLQEAELVADELAANAIRHVGEPFTVSLAFRPAHCLVAVTDPSRSEPVATCTSPSATAYHGINMVGRLSQEWGVRLVHGAGKTVWAVLPAPVPAGEGPAVPRSRTPLA